MAEEGQVIACHNLQHWNEHFQRGIDTKKLVVVDFTASWCGPCRMIAPVIADLAKKTPCVIFLKVDVDELSTVAQEWNVEAMPTIVYLKGGKEIYRVVGAKKDEIQNAVIRHASAMTA